MARPTARPDGTPPEDGGALGRLASKWTGAHGGTDWERRRWGGRRRAARDPRTVGRLLERALDRPGRVLDVACGTGRLRARVESLGHAWVGVDASPDQLLGGEGLRVRASADRLPFEDGSFDAVVACRFLHHLADPDLLAAVVRELVRVSRGPVVASFWDRATWPHAARRAAGDRSGRVAHDAALVERVFAAADATVIGLERPAWRFSAQTFVLAQAPLSRRRRP